MSDLNYRQNLIWEQIKFYRNALCQQSGIKLAIAGENKWFHSDDKSRAQYLGIAAQGQSVPADLSWKTMDGSYVTMTAALATQILSGIQEMDNYNFKNAENLKTELKAIEVPKVFNFKRGWQHAYHRNI